MSVIEVIKFILIFILVQGLSEGSQHEKKSVNDRGKRGPSVTGRFLFLFLFLSSTPTPPPPDHCTQVLKR